MTPGQHAITLIHNYSPCLSSEHSVLTVFTLLWKCQSTLLLLVLTPSSAYSALAVAVQSLAPSSNSCGDPQLLKYLYKYFNI